MIDEHEKFWSDMVTCQGIVKKISRVYGVTTEEQEDLFQEIVYNAWKSYPSFQGRSKFSTWLYRVALNTALHQNRQNKFKGRFIELDRAIHMVHEEQDDRLELLHRAIRQLEPPEKSVVLLYLDELSYKEISEITGLTETNVGVKLNRVKSKIRKILSSYGLG